MQPIEHLTGRGRGRPRQIVSALAAASFLVLAAACRQDMHDQPKYVPLRQSSFFGDERSARPLVPGTVARGHLRDDTLLYTGKINGADATVFPLVADARVMARGQERFDIYCSPCHGRTGQGGDRSSTTRGADSQYALRQCHALTPELFVAKMAVRN